VQGPTEIDAHSQADMGLSDADIALLTQEWLTTMTAAQQYIIDRGAYTWSLIPGQANANAQPQVLAPSTCGLQMLQGCAPAAADVKLTVPVTSDSDVLLWGVAIGNSSDPLPQIEQDVAAFLLLRGPYAFIGAGVWGMTWDVGTGWQNATTPTVALPPQLTRDYGEPTSVCVETTPNVFQRNYTRAQVTLDCNSFTASIDSM
jgi:hypothetical protein